MSKKYLAPVLFSCILMVSKSLSAQIYTESSSFGNTYTPLTNPTLITNTWTPTLFLQGDLQTSFNWFGKEWPFDGKNEDGILLFGAGTLAGGCPTDSTDFDFDGFFISLQSKANSAMDYEIDGDAPNRIIKFEWKNTGLASGDTSDFLNFQMWLYENATYEVHFGTSSIKDPNVAFGNGLTGPPIGLFFASTKKKDNNKILSAYYLTGSPSNPVLNHSVNYSGLKGMPANGSTYTFTHTANAGISNSHIDQNVFGIYPNPAKGMATILYNSAGSDILHIEVLDITGKSIADIFNGPAGKGIRKFNLNTSGYPKGMYLVRILDGESEETGKLVVE